jgi:hypothetical protein
MVQNHECISELLDKKWFDSLCACHALHELVQPGIASAAHGVAVASKEVTFFSGDQHAEDMETAQGTHGGCKDI